MKFIGKLFLYSFFVIIFLLFILENSFFVYDFFFSVPWQMEAKFDSKKWKTDDGYGECIRGNMLHDLLTNYLHQGMDRKEVEDLIGYNSENDKYNAIDYNIGNCNGIRELIIKYDKNNKLQAVIPIIDRY